MEWVQLAYAGTKDIAPFLGSFCSHCKKMSYWFVFDEHVPDPEEELKRKRLRTAVQPSKSQHRSQPLDDGPILKKIQSSRMIVPDQCTAPPAHPDMPDDVRTDYDEARSVARVSPRSAAALLRLAIQRLCVHLGQSGKNLNHDIGALVKEGLPQEIQQALDVLRVVGNNAVHPGELSCEDVTDVVGALFSLLNEIIEERISRPRERRELFERLPAAAREAIAKRDQSNIA